MQGLQAAGASQLMAQAAAQSLVLAEAQGLASHGLYRASQYATHLRNGRAHGGAQPAVLRRTSAALLVDAQSGLAFGACALAVNEAIASARAHGVCFAGVVNSHHAGVMVDHLRPVAAAGMVGLAFSNAPAAMPTAGGRHPIFGTNPVAAIFPRREAPPLMLDLALSEVARGKLMVAAREGQPIPTGWALDAQGQPTCDPLAGMDGMMLALGGGAKGAMLALMVELLVTAVIGAQFGFEASSCFVDEGNARFSWSSIRAHWPATIVSWTGSSSSCAKCCATKACACQAHADGRWSSMPWCMGSASPMNCINNCSNWLQPPEPTVQLTRKNHEKTTTHRCRRTGPAGHRRNGLGPGKWDQRSQHHQVRGPLCRRRPDRRDGPHGGPPTGQRPGHHGGG
jgi:(2R)-3-sulfolactate dehydrogenase (NADP+)